MPKLLCFMLLSVALGPLGLAQGRQAAEPSKDFGEHWERILQQARSGSPRAERLVSRFQAFCEKNGLQPGAVQFTPYQEALELEASSLHVTGVAPIYLEISNQLASRDEAGLERYIESRRKALRALTARQPAFIRGAINPDQPLPLREFFEIKRTYGIDSVTHLAVEVFQNGRRTASVMVDDQGRSGRDQLRGNYAELHASLGEFAATFPENRDPREGRTGDPTRGDVESSQAVQVIDTVMAGRSREFKVVFSVVSVQGSEAGRLDADSRILLFDPIDDLVNHYRNNAADIRCRMPRLTVLRRSLQER